MDGYGRKTLLLVEDESIIALAEAAELRSRGYEVEIALTGEKAVALAADPRFDLVLMDVDLGSGMDGSEAARRILEIRDIPIVFLSNHVEPDVVASVEAIASYGYVVKNSGITVLDASIKMAFRLRESRLRESEAESELRRTRKIAADIVERIPSGLFIWRRVGPGRLVLEDANPEAIRLTGISPDAWKGRDFDEVWPSAKAIGLTERYLRVIESGEPWETEDLHYRDSRLAGAYHIHAFPLPDERLAVAFEDVTSRVHAREELSDRNRLLEEVLELTMAGYWDWNIAENAEYMSPAFKRMFGYEDHELPNLPDTWQRLIFPEDLPGVMANFERHVKSRGEYPYYNEVRYRHKDGSTVWVICAGRVVEWGENGEPLRMLGFHVDITAAKRAGIVAREEKFPRGDGGVGTTTSRAGFSSA